MLDFDPFGVSHSTVNATDPFCWGLDPPCAVNVGCQRLSLPSRGLHDPLGPSVNARACSTVSPDGHFDFDPFGSSEVKHIVASGTGISSIATRNSDFLAASTCAAAVIGLGIDPALVYAAISAIEKSDSGVLRPQDSLGPDVLAEYVYTHGEELRARIGACPERAPQSGVFLIQ